MNVVSAKCECCIGWVNVVSAKWMLYRLSECFISISLYIIHIVSESFQLSVFNKMNYPSYIPGCGCLEEGAESDTIRLSGRRMVQVDAGPGEQSIESESAPWLAPQKQRGPAIHARTVQRPDRRTRSCEIHIQCSTLDHILIILSRPLP